jgi:hypothetical protein
VAEHTHVPTTFQPERGTYRPNVGGGGGGGQCDEVTVELECENSVAGWLPDARAGCQGAVPRSTKTDSLSWQGGRRVTPHESRAGVEPAQEPDLPGPLEWSFAVSRDMRSDDRGILLATRRAG